MNREIKFRVWDDKKKRIRPVKGIHWFKHTDIFVPVDGEDNCNECVVDAKLMQYTGLKDKNNVEIFEGDIIYYWANKTKSVATLEIGDDFLMCFVVESNHCPEILASKYMEVIGNIYENKELLE